MQHWMVNSTVNSGAYTQKYEYNEPNDVNIHNLMSQDIQIKTFL